jgi:hypothetical protein
MGVPLSGESSPASLALIARPFRHFPCLLREPLNFSDNVGCDSSLSGNAPMRQRTLRLRSVRVALLIVLVKIFGSNYASDSGATIAAPPMTEAGRLGSLRR